MITKEQYDAAVLQEKAATAIINQFHKENAEKFTERMQTNPVFTEDELLYSAGQLCPCGHGLAYPKECGPHHYWDCSAILKGVQDNTITHTDKLPFAFYDVKGESEHRGTTRGVFLPKSPQLVDK